MQSTAGLGAWQLIRLCLRTDKKISKTLITDRCFLSLPIICFPGVYPSRFLGTPLFLSCYLALLIQIQLSIKSVEELKPHTKIPLKNRYMIFCKHIKEFLSHFYFSLSLSPSLIAAGLRGSIRGESRRYDTCHTGDNDPSTARALHRAAQLSGTEC